MSKKDLSSKTWTPNQFQLFHSVFQATKKESLFVPMNKVVSINDRLIRSVDKQYLRIESNSISLESKLNAIKVFENSNTDTNRFTGKVTGFGSSPSVQPERGGLYCSKDAQAQMAELYYYYDPIRNKNLPNPPLEQVLLPKCFAVLKPVRNIEVANLASDSSFYDKLQRNNDVYKALRACGYTDLLQAVTNANDYSAARGLGLGLAANKEIDGAELPSARDYETTVDGQPATQTGDNVVLFKQHQQFAQDMVRVESMNVINQDKGALTATKYENNGSGLLVETSSIVLL